MTVTTPIKAEITAWIDRKSFNDGINFARDTGKKINQQLRASLELDIAKSQIQLRQLRKDLSQATGKAKIDLQVQTNKAQQNLTELKRKLNNLRNTWDIATSRLQRKFDSLNVSKLDNSIKWMISSFKWFFGAAAVVWLITRAFSWLRREFSLASESATKFQKAMSNVSTLVDTSVESMEDMSAELLDIAKRVPVSIDELTVALYDVRSAGIAAEDAMSVLEQSAKLATAGLGTTKEAVNLMTSAFNAFSTQWYTAEEIASTFFLAVKNGKTTIAELSQGFGKLAAVAANLWVDFKELVAASTALTTTGLSASEAYTQIQGILVAVAKQTPQSVKAAKDLWFEFSASALEAKWLKWFLDDLSQSLKDNWYEWSAATEVLSKMFGRVEALSWVLWLTNANAEAFVNTLTEMTSESTAFIEAYDKQAATLEARQANLNNQLEVQRIKLGTNTSLWKWFGTYLQIQFLDILNKVTKSLTLIADVAIWSFKIMFNAAKDSFLGIGKALDNFFSSGKFKFDEAFNFEGTKSELNALRNKIVDTFDWSSTKAAEAVKKRNDIIEELNDELSKDQTDTAKLTSKEIEDLEKERIDKIKDFYEEEQEAYEKMMDEKEQKTKNVYDVITKAIDDSKKSIEDYNNEINDIDDDIISRLADIENKLQSWDLTWSERNALIAEKQSAYKWLSLKEGKELQDKVNSEVEFEKLTEIEKLQVKKQQLEAEKEQELTALEDLNNAKKVLEDDFERFDIGKKDAEKARVQDLIDKYRELNAVRGGGSVPSGATSSSSSSNTVNNTTNNNGGVSININAETNATPEQVANALISAYDSYTKWNNS